MKWVLWILGGLLGIVAIAAIFIYVGSNRAFHKVYEVPAARPLYVRADSASLARGQHLANAVALCAECHGDKLEGKILIDGQPFATLWAPNLTSGKGGLFPDYDITAFDRAVRHGIDRNGRALWLMPANHYCYMSNSDVAALYAYVQSLPPVDNECPPFKPGPIARLLAAQSKLHITTADLINHDAQRPAMPEPDTTIAYGEYLCRLACIGCHGPDLSGGAIHGTPPDFPPAANITPAGIGHYTEADFIAAMLQGVRPGGAVMNEFMPSKWFKDMTDGELRALWLYLQTVPPQPYANSTWLDVRVP